MNIYICDLHNRLWHCLQSGAKADDPRSSPFFSGTVRRDLAQWSSEKSFPCARLHRRFHVIFFQDSPAVIYVVQCHLKPERGLSRFRSSIFPLQAQDTEYV